MSEDARRQMLSVILIDDDPARAARVKASLTEAGCSVMAIIPTGGGLLFQMAQHEPDVVIVALDSPDRDVLESLSIASEHNPKPVLMFSETGDANFVTEAIQSGVTAYQAEGINPRRVRMAMQIAIAQFDAHAVIRSELTRTKRQLKERSVLEQAKILLITKKHMTEDEAYAALRSTAMNRRCSVGEAAESVVALLGDVNKKGGELS